MKVESTVHDDQLSASEPPSEPRSRWPEIRRLFNQLVTINFVIATLAYAAYLVFWLVKGVDIDEHWGFKHHRGPNMWLLIAIVHAQVVFAFIAVLFSDEPRTFKDRLPFLIGGVILFFAGASQPITFYLACSVLAWAIFGTEEL